MTHTLLTTKALAEQLGLQRYQLTYVIDRGIVPDAGLRIAGRRVFTEEEARHIADILHERTASDAKPASVRVDSCPGA